MTQREHTGVRATGGGRFPRSVPVAPAVLIETPAPPGVRRRDQTFRAALVIADLTAALLVVAADNALFGPHGPRAIVLALPLLVLLGNTAAGLYRRDELVLSTNTLDEAPTVFRAATLSAVLTFLLASFADPMPLGGQYVAVTLAGLTTSTLLLRVAARAAARRVTAPERCLLVGDAGAEGRLHGRLRTAPAVKAELVGRWSLDGSPPDTLLGLRKAVRETDAQRLVIAGDSASPERVHETIQLAKSLGIKVSLLPGTFDAVGSSVAFDYLGGLTLLGVRRFGLSRRSRFIKRGMDCVASAGLLLMLSPLLLAIALAVRVSSRGPVFFRQTRVGRDGRPFQIVKFRSMVADAEARKAALRSSNEADGLFKIQADPRITSVGRLLRQSSLDELPQLLNVLRGEMSLVGPRPLVVDEDRQIHGWHRRRLDLTPGVTGAWQVLGAARVPMREMVAIDYLYVANWSLWEDVKVLLRTVPCVLGRRGQ